MFVIPCHRLYSSHMKWKNSGIATFLPKEVGSLILPNKGVYFNVSVAAYKSVRIYVYAHIWPLSYFYPHFTFL